MDLPNIKGTKLTIHIQPHIRNKSIYTSVNVSLPVLWWHHDSEVYLCQYRQLRLCTIHTSTTDTGFFLPLTSWSNVQHSISFRAVHRGQLGNAAGFSKYFGVFPALSATTTFFIQLNVTVTCNCIIRFTAELLLVTIIFLVESSCQYNRQKIMLLTAVHCNELAT